MIKSMAARTLKFATIDSTVALLVHDRRRSAYVEAITAREIARRLTVLAGGSVDARR